MRGFAVPVVVVSTIVPLFSQASKPAPADYSKEAFVLESSITTVTFENDGTATRDATARVRINSDAGVQRFGLLKLPYEGAVETIEIPYVRVMKKDGTTISTPPDSFQDMPAEVTREAPFYSDLREKHIAVKGLSPGDVLEYEVVGHRTKPLAPGQFWFDYSFSRDAIVLQEEVAISAPRDRAVKFKCSTVTATIAESNGRRIYTWKSSNLEIKKKDDSDDYAKATAAARGRAPSPDLRFSTFQSWDEVGKWYGGLQQERVKPTPEVRAKAEELTKNAADADSKLHLLYNYVSLQFRYIGVAFGVGRYQPHTAAEVINNQYGDCKDKHTLLASLLASVGVNAYPALVSVAHSIDPDIPSPSQFDHVITAVAQGSGYIWLDTTAEVAPFGMLIAPIRGKQALVVSDNKAPAFVSTPDDPPFPTVQSVNVEGKLDSEGTFDAKFVREDRGDTEVLLRTLFRRLPESQWPDIVQNISYLSGFGGTVSNISTSLPEATDKPFSFTYNYNRKSYSDWENRRVSPPLPYIMLPGPKEDEKPKDPIWLGPISQIRFVARMELPKGYTLDVPTTINLKNDFADYSASYTLKDGVLITERSLTTKQHEVPVAEYAAYKAFKKSVEDDRERFLQLHSARERAMESFRTTVQNKLAALPDSALPEANRAEHDAMDAVHRGDLPGAIVALKKSVAADPKFTRAWLRLAGAEQAMTFQLSPDATSSSEASFDAYRKAIESAPQEPLSYKLLGYALMAKQRYSEAASTWQQLTKITPDDADAFGNLGTCLRRLKRYQEAVGEYETAMRLGLVSANTYIYLGSSYYGAGHDEKGAAAMQKAIEVDPSAETENNAAWELVELGKNLPQALEWSRKSVQTVEEASRKVELDDVKLDDVRRMDSLSAYWDTLGWIYFKMGDMDKAESFLGSAWALSPRSVIGDHLGQLYEKQNKTAAAIHAYQLALAADPQQSETRDRLQRLDPKGSMTAFNPNDLTPMRTVTLSPVVPGQASADFFLKITPAKVADVRFISGSENLKSATAMLMGTNFKFSFPSGSDAALVVRGTLSCSEASGCSFIWLFPGMVGSVN